MRTRLAGSNVYLWVIALAGSFLAETSIYAGTLNGMGDPARIPGKFIVVLKRDHIASLRNPMLTDEREIASRSTNWQAAKTAADAEVAQMVAKLRKAHPHVQISAVMSHGQAPGFVLKASDQDAKAIADEDDVSEVDADSPSDAVKNVTATTGPAARNRIPAVESGDPVN
jgi:hypothetical protein